MKFKAWGFDQYDSFLVSADSKQECEEIVKEKYPPKERGEVIWQEGFTIQPIGSTNKDKGILLDSYNAG